MALVDANGSPAIETKPCFPRIGAWHCDLLVDDPAVLTGSVRIVIDTQQQAQGLVAGLVLVGTAIPGRSGVFVDTGHVRVVAGAGGLGLSAAPKHYNGTSLGIVLRDLLATAGETLSAIADASVLGTDIDSWTTTAKPIGAVIADLFRSQAPTAAWRMLPDGTMWAGVETWPDSGLDPTTYQIFEQSAEQGSMLVGIDAPALLPGTTFEGQRVSYVEHSVGQAGEGVEMRVWFEDAAVSDVDRALAAFDALVRGTPAGIDHRFRYWADVVSQGGATVDAEAELPGIPDMGQVPLAAQAGDSVDGVTGGRVIVGWAGDPSQRYAAGFDSAAMPTTRTLAVLQMLFLGAKGAPPAIVGAHQAAEAALVTALILAFGELAGACTAPPLDALAAGFGAVGTALTSYQTAASAANNFLSTKVGVSP